MGHPDLHRVLKELVKEEREQGHKELKFSRAISNVIMKNFEEVIKSRAVFIVLELIENEQTKDLIFS